MGGSRWEEVLPIYREQYKQFKISCMNSQEEGESVVEALETAQRL